MPIPLEIVHERSFSGTRRRIFNLLAEMGTSGDAIWPFASQPFMRTAGPLTPGRTEEWHSGVHAVLAEVVPEERIVWQIDNEGFEGTHGFYLSSAGKKVHIVHRIDATLSDTEGRLFWKRFDDVHARTMQALYDKLERVLKR
jgi:hypothetical protein